MSSRIIITKEIIEKTEYLITALFSDNRLVDVSCDHIEDAFVLGNVYVGKIKRILPKTNSAFVEIAPGEITYLSLEDVKAPLMVKQSRQGQLTENDEIIVQIAKEAVKTKVPTVSTNITLKGNAVVLTTENKRLGVSKKLDRKKREHFQEIFAEKKEKEIGLIIRTIAGKYSDEEIFAEYVSISDVYRKIIQNYQHRTCYSCLFHAPAPYISSVKEKLSENVEKIITDEHSVYEELAEKVEKEKLVYYEDKQLSLSALYGLKHKLMEALEEHVWLKSGAYLVIQPTEALTVIDVNSGKCVKGSKKDFYLKINLEAAEEIARQLRLRNISGICIVDFINLDTEEAKEELIRTMRRYLAEDTVPAVFVDFTKLGLAEITRKKVKKPLWEQIKK